MVFREISHILARYLIFFSLALLLPLGVAAYYQFFADPLTHPQPHSTMAFLNTLLISFSLSFLLWLIGRKAKGELYRREGVLVVLLIWLLTSFVSALPFYLNRTLTNPIDAYFEAMSGITTTGSSVICAKAYDPETGQEVPLHITNANVPSKTYTYYGTVPPVRDPETGLILYSGVEAVSKALLLWRSFLQWIGGMGIVVIFLTVLPALSVGGKLLYQTEITGPIKDEIAPRMKQTASLLWKLYLTLTFIEINLLFWTNSEMTLFDAVCTSFSNISTGGFSVRSDSIASYHSAITDWIVILFMVLGSISFVFYFRIFRPRSYGAYLPDFLLQMGISAAASLLVSLSLLGYRQPGSEMTEIYTAKQAFLQGTFQSIAAQTSTGFTIADYDKWPFPSQMLMLLLMFVGGMAGSTAGGIKTSRFYILYKIIRHRLESIYRPDSVQNLRIGDAKIDDKNALTILGFFCIVGLATVLGTSLFVLNGIDPETSLGLIANFINNTGIAFRAAGPAESFAFLPTLSKTLATFWMLLGRLEYYVVLLLFLPAFWKNR